MKKASHCSCYGVLISALLSCLMIFSVRAEEPKHGSSLVGALKYPEGFSHFDYVNPKAPKGGQVTLSSTTPFDSFNVIIPEGVPAAGLGLIYDTLMTASLDELSSSYGLIASSLSYPDDYSSTTFRLRPEARWNDGQPITADDVIFSFNTMIEKHPLYKSYYSYVERVEKINDHEVTFIFNVTGNRELPHILGQIILFPKHYWQGKDKDGNPRDIGRVTLEPPLGSGSYRIAEFIPGRSVTYERVKDYWAKDLNIMIGQNNFDQMIYKFFVEPDAAFDSFKLGQIDWRTENTAKRWAVDYDFPAVNDGKVIKEQFLSEDQGVMQGFLFNLRRDKFSDIRVRKALAQVYNFEDANRAFFHNQYERINSYFFPTELASSGLPEGQELAYLEEVRDLVPPSVFTEVFTNSFFAEPGDDRKARREALRLLKEAGWIVKNGKLTGDNGEQMTIEFLLASSAFEKIVLHYKQSLEQLGIEVSVRLVDPSQFLQRVNDRDFDIITTGWGQSLSPGNEQKEYWGSEAADTNGSRNYMGVSDKAIDHLISKVILAKDRPSLISATKALDRVLLHNHFLVPQWSSRWTRTARWDRFSRVDPLPQYAAPGFPAIWWWDEAKAAAIQAN